MLAPKLLLGDNLNPTTSSKGSPRLDLEWYKLK